VRYQWVALELQVARVGRVFGRVVPNAQGVEKRERALQCLLRPDPLLPKMSIEQSGLERFLYLDEKMRIVHGR
jgi:hypothetical protein